MKKRCFDVFLVTILFVFVVIPSFSIAKEVLQTWELIRPDGIVSIEPLESIKINPHPTTLEGKTVVLRANGKHNSDVFLNRVAELLTQRVKGVKVVKMWQIDPTTFRSIDISAELSKKWAAQIADLGADLVIAAQCD